MTDKVRPARFSDTELIMLNDKFDKHIAEEKILCENILKRQEDYDKEHNEFKEMLKDQTVATEGLIKLWRSAQGTIFIMTILSKLATWIIGIAGIGWVLTELVKSVKQ